MTETRVNVEHYNTSEIEVIDYIRDQFSREEFRAIVLANIIKYASRAKHKGQFASDLEKIRNYAVILQESEAKYEAAELWDAALSEGVDIPVITPPRNVPTREVPAPTASFKRGDKVRVVNGHVQIPTGSVHEVTRFDGRFVYVDATYGGGWLPGRFELVEPEPRVFDRTEDVPEDVGLVRTADGRLCHRAPIRGWWYLQEDTDPKDASAEAALIGRVGWSEFDVEELPVTEVIV
ncbi:hypothetical protein SEA_NEDARYA_58 [Gordonia phage Nedarya]|nr:hypothetical protein SEA_NEDARYA_58 [Gordonia phage Nedarya]